MHSQVNDPQSLVVDTSRETPLSFSNDQITPTAITQLTNTMDAQRESPPAGGDQEGAHQKDQDSKARVRKRKEMGRNEWL